MRGVAARWAERRARREAARFADAPRVQVNGPWRRGSKGQTLRAFVQINVLPRP
jgi:hypothetical protein